jgi:hypothetical protein
MLIVPLVSQEELSPVKIFYPGIKIAGHLRIFNRGLKMEKPSEERGTR